ncbi:MAG: 16S rRNA (cytidine(1402)-2'-O)-methyltransferase [Nitrospiraceae bacterium]
MAGSLYIVGTPIGNPDDLSLRALRTLQDVAVIAAEDPQCTQALLIRHGITTPLTSYQNDNKEEKIPVLIQRLREGRSVALVSDAGTPAIVDPGALLICEALRQGIAVVPVPGPSALLAALSASGLPGDTFVFAGVLPARQAARRKFLRALRPDQRTIVLFESPRRLPAALKALRAALGNRRIILACNLTTPQERFFRGTIDEIIRAPTTRAIQGELTLVIEGAQPRRQTQGKRTRTSG